MDIKTLYLKNKMETKKIKNWFKRLLRGRVIDAYKIQQLKQNGIIPVFSHSNKLKGDIE